MTTVQTLIDLESLFIEKLQEKYKLNKKDLKRVFSRFDTDNNGLLDLQELTKGVQMFLNGVKESQVKKLVEKYDINGDGKISYDEFLHLLTSRGAIDEYDDISISNSSHNSIPNSSRNSDISSRNGVNFDNSKVNRNNQPKLNEYLMNKEYGNMNDDVDTLDGDYFDSNQQADVDYIRPKLSRPNAVVDRDADMSIASSRLSDLNVDNPKDIDYRVKIFLDSLKSHLIKQATQMRMSGGVDDSLARMNASEFHESAARMMVAKAFQKYTGRSIIHCWNIDIMYYPTTHLSHHPSILPSTYLSNHPTFCFSIYPSIGQGEGKARELISGVELPDFVK